MKKTEPPLKGGLTALLLLLGIVSLASLGPIGSITQANSKSEDSSSTRAASPTGLNNDFDPYGVFPRYDSNSSVRKRNATPKGYRRISSDSVSGFGLWLRDYPMRSESEPLTTYNGTFIGDATVIGGVLDVPTTSPGYGSRGILYPLMHEFARVMGREMELNYRGLVDDSVSLYRYMTGKYSTNLNRTKYFWKETEEKPLDADLLQRYSEFVRTVTSYKSLIRDCQEISEADVLPGDIFIQTDSTPRPNAHLSIALDVATWDPKVAKSSVNPTLKDKNGFPYRRIVLFGNGLTPASSFHIIKPIKPGKGNWMVPGELEDKLKHVGPGRFYRIPYQFLR